MTKKLNLMKKDQIFEWLNPILNGDTTDGFAALTGNCNGNIQTPQNPYTNNDCDDFMENPPAWLNTCDVPSSPNQVGNVGNGNIGRDTLGAMFIDGVPVSNWGAMYGGNAAYFRKNVMNNFIDVTNHIMAYMNDITAVNFNRHDDDDVEFTFTNVIIQKMSPTDSGIGVNIYLSFDLNKTNYFANFYKFGIKDNTGNGLICQPLKDSLSEENWIRVQGKLRNIIEKWLKPTSGIYKCLAKEVLVYNQFGQLNRVKANDIIEIVKSDNEKITIIWNNAKWLIKTPTYWWFNYYFSLLKK